jgi:hypothetical protein
LRLNRRSLQRAGIAAAEVEEVDPTDPGVVRTVTELHRTLPLHVERPRMDLTLQRHDVRVFLGPDGYLLSRNDWGGDLSVQGVVSPTEREAELALGALDWSGGSNAEIELGPDEGARATRLTRVMSHWHASPQGMFRIIDWPGLLESLKPLLARRAEGLPAFVTCVGCCWRDDTEWATVSWDGAELSVDSTRRADAIEVGLALLTALVCGGPHASPSDLGPLGRLLPVPVHIPSLDHV